ncbi:hypothetical protein [Streptacidiphilus sp. MAP5-3]|jgi:hypothetical protein
MTPCLEAITDQWQEEGQDALANQHVEDARRLAIVLRFCAVREVELHFI